MKNPGETSALHTNSGKFEEECTKQADPCSSPPCKRLKQAVLSFPSRNSPQSTSVSPNAIHCLSNITCDDTAQTEPSQTKEVKCVNGGLVTCALSPPDVELTAQKQHSPKTPSHVSTTLPIEEERELSINKDIYIASTNSSPVENNVIIINQSPPAKNHFSLDSSCKPAKSSEKVKKSKEEREREKIERQKLREEKLREKQEIKAAKEKERLDAKRKRDEERLEKQAEKEKRDKEKSEKREKEEQERLEKKKKRDEERRKKEEERTAKNEEKRKREEEKKSQEEEQARKRQKVQESFANFFVKPTVSTPKTLHKTCSRFRPFEVKQGMTLAPAIRKQPSLEGKSLLDKELSNQGCDTLYLKELEARKPIPRYNKRKLSTIAEHEPEQEGKSETNANGEVTLIDENSNSSVEFIEKKATTAGLTFKLLQFHTNYRPAYFGTHRKTSLHISPKNPFKKDMELLDYEVDSDDEWEEEEPGESLSNSEGEDEDGEDDGDEDEDGFFVPHGYLSDDEGVEDEDSEDDKENMEKVVTTKEDRQLAKAKAWEAEMKRKCKPLKPVNIGCLWFDDATINSTLKQFEACLLVDTPIDTEKCDSRSNETSGELLNTPAGTGALYVPDEAMPDLIKLVHGNTAGLNKLILQFRKQWTSKCLGRVVADDEVDEKSPVSKRQLEKRIQLIATKERRADKLRWYVHKNILEQFSLENLQVPEGIPTLDTSIEAVKLTTSPPSNTPSIIKFTKTMTLNKGSSPEPKPVTSEVKQGDLESNLSSMSPMEVDTASPLTCDKICQPTMKSETPSMPNGAVLHSCINGNKIFPTICKKLELSSITKTDCTTGSAMPRAVTDAALTIYID